MVWLAVRASGESTWKVTVASMCPGPVSLIGVVKRNELSEEIVTESLVTVGLSPAVLLTH